MMELYRAARVAVETCAAVKPGEEVLVVNDTLEVQSVGHALAGAARAVGAEAMLLTYPARQMSPQEPPRTVTDAMKSADVVFCHTSTSLTHSKARREAQKAGARVITMAGVSEDTFLRTMLVDVEQTSVLTRRLAGRIAVSRSARLTSNAGTDLTMELGNEPFVVDGLCREPGGFNIIPFGTLVVVPKLGSPEGRVVADGSITGIGKLSTPVILSIKQGRLTGIDGGSEAAQLGALLEGLQDPGAYNCPAEWGVGTNPGARLTGEEPSFEGERVRCWAHVSMGANASFPGGTVESKVHIDAIFKDVSLELDGRVVIQDRQFLLD